MVSRSLLRRVMYYVSFILFRVEHHLKSTPTVPADSLSHVYSVVVYPNNTYAIYVDNESKSSGSMETDFDPPFTPPVMIDDPEDKKPEDWYALL